VEYYQKKRGSENTLEFHRSKTGQEIIERMIQDCSSKWKDIGNIDFFKKVIHESPSSIEFFKSLQENKQPEFIKSPDIFKKMFSSPGLDTCYIDVHSTEEDQAIYLNNDLSLNLLTKDYLAYPTDKHIKELFILSLIQKNLLSVDSQMMKYRMMFEWIMKSIKNKSISLNDTSEENWKKTANLCFSETKTSPDCANHWYVYLPPMGEPRFKCNGCSKNL
jgi:hypothetical protein